METKLQKTKNETRMPAGILNGTEAFWHDGQKWIIHEGHATRFEAAPIKVQNMIAEAFLADTEARRYLTRIGCTAFSKAFDFWYRCKLGALDSIPDFINNNFTPDAYNSACTDYDCVHRGKFCSMASGLKNYEVKSLAALKEGYTVDEAAAQVYVSPAGMKSRVEKMKEKLGARNLPQLTAIAAELGI